MSAKKYYRKELGVEAMRVEEGNVEELYEWINSYQGTSGEGSISIKLNAGVVFTDRKFNEVFVPSGVVFTDRKFNEVFVPYGDYFIKFNNGFSPVSKETFKKDYLPVSDYKKSIENWFALD